MSVYARICTAEPGFAMANLGPRIQKPPAKLEEVASRVGRFGLVHNHVSERGLNNRSRNVGLLSGSVEQRTEESMSGSVAASDTAHGQTIDRISGLSP